MKIRKDAVKYTLYLATDSKMLEGRDFFHSVEEAILGGVTVVQLREKDASSRKFYQKALELKKICAKYHVPLIINDRLDIALAVDADGLHIGQDDLPLPVARRLLGEEKILGYSVSGSEEAAYGESCGADYLGAGTVFPTGTKNDAGVPIGLKVLEQIKNQVSIPVVGIGGINETNVKSVQETGVDGACIISGILLKPDIQAASRELISLWNG